MIARRFLDMLRTTQDGGGLTAAMRGHAPVVIFNDEEHVQ